VYDSTLNTIQKAIYLTLFFWCIKSPRCACEW